MIQPETDEHEDLAPERPHVCPECTDSFETLRQFVAHQTHKHGYRHPPGIVTVTNTCAWCRNIYRDRRATYLHHQQSWKRGYCTGRGSHLHTVVIPVNTSCSHSDQHFESVAMLFEHLRTVFFRWNGEMQNWALTQSSGTPEARPQRTKRPRDTQGQPHPDTQKQMLLILSRLALKHDLEIRELQAATFRTLLVKQDEPLMLASKGATGLFVAKSKGGTATSGRAACSWMGGHDDGYDHGPSTLGGRQAESDDIHVQCKFTGDSLAEHLLEPVQKNISEGLGQVAVFSVASQTQPILCLIIKAMKSRGAKEKFGQAPAGGNLREHQHMFDDLQCKLEGKEDSNC